MAALCLAACGARAQARPETAQPEAAPASAEPVAVAAAGPTVELVDFAAPPRSAATPPLALLNAATPAPDGSGRLYLVDARGTIWRVGQDGKPEATPFLDGAAARGGALGRPVAASGLRSLAFHPDFARPGARGFGRLYTLSTEVVDASPPADVRVFKGPAAPTSQDVLAEWRVEAGPDGRVDARSRRELLRIDNDQPSAVAESLIFDPRAKPGQGDHGKLYIAVGLGGASASDFAQARGKLLRIDPLGGTAKGYAYGVPKDNPFIARPGALAEIWATGLGRPEGLSFDPAGAGPMIVVDSLRPAGPELKLARSGADLAKPAAGPSARHDGRRATGGFVYRGTAVPALVGQYVFGDVVEGRLFAVDAAALQSGAPVTVRELRLMFHRRPLDLMLFVGRVNRRVDLRLGQGADGELYLTTMQDGRVYRVSRPADAAPGSAPP